MATKTPVTEVVESDTTFDPTPQATKEIEPEVTELDDDGDTGEEFPLDQYSVRVNGKIVWTSGSEARLVNMVKVNNARGEVTAIGSHTGDRYLDITVNVRNAMGSDLDLVEYRKELERTAALEEALSPAAFKEQEERNKVAVKTVEKTPKEKVEIFESFDNDKVSEPVSKVDF